MNNQNQELTHGMMWGKSLMTAITLNSAEAIEKFIKQGADVNYKNQYGETPLMKAVNSNDPQLVKIFLEAGANVDSQNFEGQTALMKAVSIYEKEDHFEERKEILQLLLDKKPNLEIQEMYKSTALVKALNFNLYCFDALIQAGANPFVTFNTKETLATFAFYRRPEAVLTLLELGVQIDYELISDISKKTPSLRHYKQLVDVFFEKQSIRDSIGQNKTQASIVKKL